MKLNKNSKISISPLLIFKPCIILQNLGSGNSSVAANTTNQMRAVPASQNFTLNVTNGITNSSLVSITLEFGTLSNMTANYANNSTGEQYLGGNFSTTDTFNATNYYRTETFEGKTNNCTCKNGSRHDYTSKPMKQTMGASYHPSWGGYKKTNYTYQHQQYDGPKTVSMDQYGSRDSYQAEHQKNGMYEQREEPVTMEKILSVGLGFLFSHMNRMSESDFRGTKWAMGVNGSYFFRHKSELGTGELKNGDASEMITALDEKNASTVQLQYKETSGRQISGKFGLTSLFYLRPIMASEEGRTEKNAVL